MLAGKFPYEVQVDITLGKYLLKIIIKDTKRRSKMSD